MALVACGQDREAPEPFREAVPAGFTFVRDPVGMFPPGLRKHAEEELRAMARATGVYGVVVAATEVPDPPVVVRPIFEEVAGAGGQLLLAFCTPDACDLRSASSVSEALSSRVEAVAPEAEPVVGNANADANRNLGRWVEFVAAVAGVDE
ncbi:MAG: hypothetical protein ACR2G3_02410 [Solirubrobacterales bacterium]